MRASQGMSNPNVGHATLDVRVWAREGIKMCQVLIDTKAQGQGLLLGISNVGLNEAANDAIWDMDRAEKHHFVSMRQLNNGGILLELDSEGAMVWLNDPIIRDAFLGRFAPDAKVKEQAFPLMVQFVPLHFRLEKTMELRQLEKDNNLPANSILQA